MRTFYLCTRCRIQKPFEKFYKSKGTKRGVRSRCIDCETLVRKAKTAEMKAAGDVVRHCIIVKEIPGEKQAELEAELAKLQQRNIKCVGCAEKFIAKVASGASSVNRLFCPQCIVVRVVAVKAERLSND